MYFVAAAIGFLIGSIPFSLLVALGAGGVDLRRQGSGNIGATNVARLLGVRWGALAFLLDGLKGLIPVVVLPWWYLADTSGTTHPQVITGLAAIAGHMFPPWLGFRGGKGVATAFGVVLALAPWASLCALAGFALVMALSRIVSLSSVCAVLVFAVAQLVGYGSDMWQPSTWSLGLFSVIAPLLIIVRHRANLSRLLRGEEMPLRVHGGSTDSQAGAGTEHSESSVSEKI